MSDLKRLEDRITTALDRIRSAALNRASSDDLDLRLQNEQQAKADLEDRVAALKARQDTKIADMERKAAEHVRQMKEIDSSLQRLRAANADLRQQADELRRAASDQAVDAEQINRILVAEIEAVSADRAAEAAEVAAVLSELKPHLEEES